MELPHKNTHLERSFHPQLVYHDSITLCVEFFLEFFVWKRCTSSKFKQNKLEIQSCFVPIISNVDDRTYNGPAKRIRLRGVMSHDKRIQFNSGGSPFSPPSQPPCQQQSQQKPNRNQQQQHQLHQTFWMICLLESTVFRITLICIFSNKAKSSVLNKLINCLLCVAFFRKRWRAVRGPPPIIFYSLPYQSLLCMYSFPFEKGIRLEKQNSRYLGDNLCSKKQLWYLKFVLCINKLSFLFVIVCFANGLPCFKTKGDLFQSDSKNSLCNQKVPASCESEFFNQKPKMKQKWFENHRQNPLKQKVTFENAAHKAALSKRRFLNLEFRGKLGTSNYTNTNLSFLGMKTVIFPE